MEGDRRFFQLRDILIILAVLLLSGAALFAAGRAGGGEGAVAQIYVDGGLTREIDLARVERTETILIDAQLRVAIEVSPRRDPLYRFRVPRQDLHPHGGRSRSRPITRPACLRASR